jgi:hypothetical protein
MKEKWARDYCKTYSIDPAMIAVILQAIQEAFKMIQECQANKTWPRGHRSRKHWAAKLKLKTRVRQAIGENNYHLLGRDRFIDALNEVNLNEIEAAMAEKPVAEKEPVSCNTAICAPVFAEPCPD